VRRRSATPANWEGIVSKRKDSAQFLDPPLCFYARHPTFSDTGNLPESCPKIGDVPKSPFRTVAALVPSAGTITLHIELCSDAGPPRAARRRVCLNEGESLATPSILNGESLSRLLQGNGLPMM
jgi:hypothetical protein